MEHYRNGDVILVSCKPSFTVGGAVQMFIRLFQNLIYVLTFQFRKVCIYHHAASIVLHGGKLCVFEAVDKGYINSGGVMEYLLKKDIHKTLIRRPRKLINEAEYICEHQNMLNKKYWFWGTLFFQPIKQLTFDRLWLSNSHRLFQKVYCSQATARALNASNNELFPKWWVIDPQDLYVSKDLFTLPNKKYGK